MPTAEQALPGRETPMSLPEFHYVFKGTSLLGPFFEGAIDFAIFGLGCFWARSAASGSVKVWSAPWSATPAASPAPTYEEVCSA
jgi:peptide-methionine (S)-S-oxide reductase